jgi:toxin HigB-1
MDVICNNKNLQKLYESGKQSKKYRLSQDIIDRFIMRVDALIAANTIHDLWQNPALNFKKMQGYDNRFSVRINKQYRLEVEIEWQNSEKTIGKIELLDVSKHYE